MTFTLKKGTNVSHWLSQSKRRGDARRAFFQRADVERIAAIGCDHIRLPIDEEQMWSVLGDKEPDAFQLLDDALAWAADCDLKVLVDLHILRSHHFNQVGTPALYTDPIEAERFAELWRVLSEHLGHQPTDRVAYELLNEPVAPDPADWNRVAHLAFDTVRRREPERQIFLGSNWYQTCDTFDALDVPDDAHTTLAFHYYNPMLITHHTAKWWPIGSTYEGPIHYPGMPIHHDDLAATSDEFRAAADAGDWNASFDRSTIKGHLQKPLIVAARTGLPLYCGEFGVYDAVPLPIRQAWYRDVLAVFDQYNIGWANWDYRGHFGLIDATGRPTGIHQAMGLTA